MEKQGEEQRRRSERNRHSHRILHSLILYVPFVPDAAGAAKLRSSHGPSATRTFAAPLPDGRHPETRSTAPAGKETTAAAGFSDTLTR